MTTDRSFRLRARGRTAGALLLAWGLVAAGAEAQAPPEYRMPPQAIADLLDAPPTPAVRVAPDGRAIALLERLALESIRDVARPELRLAGLRIDPRSNGPSRAFAYSRIVLK
ncbi:MAG: S9 family peptidase, partial [Gemmatimonadota bacterium]